MKNLVEKTITLGAEEGKTALAIMLALEHAEKDSNVLLIVRNYDEANDVKNRVCRICTKFHNAMLGLTLRAIELEDGRKIKVRTPNDMLEPGCAYSCVIFDDCDDEVSEEKWRELRMVLCMTRQAFVYKIKSAKAA